MCGIVGFTGRQQVAPILLNGLSKLEYRGYDSVGIAVRDGEHLTQVVKAKGRLSNLVEKTDEGKALSGTCGIGHTRWATHGLPSQINANVIKLRAILMKIIKTNIEAALKLILSRLVFTLRSIYLNFSA